MIIAVFPSFYCLPDRVSDRAAPKCTPPARNRCHRPSANAAACRAAGDRPARRAHAPTTGGVAVRAVKVMKSPATAGVAHVAVVAACHVVAAVDASAMSWSTWTTTSALNAPANTVVVHDAPT